MQLFYCPGINGESFYTLPDQEMHHAVHVLRMKPGDGLQITNGKGKIFDAEIVSVQKKECTVKILSSYLQNRSRNYHLHIAIAPPKSSDRVDVFLEKVTEIGVEEITPIYSNNSERNKVNHEKVLQVLIAAMKQSGDAYLPKLNGLTKLEDFIYQHNLSSSQKFIAHCKPSDKKVFTRVLQPAKDVLILIGPEGDFTAEEILLSEKNNFTSVSLGEKRLRTETAGIVACQTVHSINALKT
ncbi:MAG: 16S rRNA (uracil(1498)-N(3))-methyltransferase [Chitinophagales bacterium]